MEKSFKFDKQLGGQWHKNWNIPNIFARIYVFFSRKIQDELTFDEFSCPENLKVCFIIQARIFSVKEKSYKDFMAYKEVGLKGNTIYDISDGTLFITGIRF